MMTRRALLISLPAWTLWGGDSGFWNKKDPSDWSSDEISKLTTKSPWAHEVTVTGTGGEGRRGTGGGQSGGGQRRTSGGLGIPGIGGIGLPRTGGGGPMGIPTGGGRGGQGGPGGQGRGEGRQQFKGIVRWESAEPVQLAMRSKLPEMFANHYVIGVSGIPILNRRRDDDDDRSADRSEDNLDRLKTFTFLEPKGKSSVQPGIVHESPTSYGDRMVLFGFSKELLPLSLDDKEVAFSSRFGGLHVKATFNLKDMTFRKKLAV